MNTNQLAFYIGLFGSVHCIGMCGPLAFAIPVNTHNYWLLIWDKLIYNLGRVMSYSALGLVTGLIGRQFWLSGLQQWVSILSGVFILFAATSRLVKHPLINGKFVNNLLLPFNNALARALKNRSGHFVAGILNGFLPCGFVYLALIGSVNTNSVFAGVQYMFWFGTGTVPLMLIAAVGTGFFNTELRRRLNYIVPYFMMCLGVWFVFRGLNLDISYLSPALTTGNPVCR
ncbi:sulfite exporter TauE/SafE family protein [Mucilaginibacter sp. AW1-3]